MSDADKQKNLRSFAWQRFAELFLIVGASLMLFRPPVTWNEIFHLASLKRTSVTIDLSESAGQLQTTQTTLALQKPPYSAEWFDSLIRSFSDALQSLNTSYWSVNIGQTDLAAHRLLCLFVATAAFFILRTKHAVRLRLNHRRLFPLQTAVLISVLLLLVRWGAVEQLFVLIALASLACTAQASSKLNSDRNQTLRWLAVSALALVCANSRTWIYSLAPATFFWILLQPFKAQLIRQTTFTVAVFTAAFLGLFLTHGSYETLVGHLTQRWLHLNEPRYISVVWQGATLPWKVLCLWMGLISLRRLAAASAEQSLASRDSFAHLLIISAAAQLCYFQKTPAAADVLLLALISICQANNPSSQRKSIFLRLTDALHWLFAAALTCAFILGIFLLLSPASKTVPDLAATMSGIEFLWKNLPFLCLSALAPTMAGGYFLRKALHTVKTIGRARAARYAHFALCSVVVFLFCASELRRYFLWHPLKESIASLPPQTQLFYLPKLEPLIRLLPHTPHKKRMAAIYQGESVAQEEQHSLLLVPLEASDVCLSAAWSIQTNHGIFALCDIGKGSISHLLPMN